MASMIKNRKPAYMYPWVKRTLFIGPLIGPIHVAYGAATLVVSLGDSILIRSGRLDIDCHSLLIPPGQPVSIDAKSEVVAICHLDVLGEDFRRLCGSVTSVVNALGIGLLDEADYMRAFFDLYLQPADSNSVYQKLEALVIYGGRHKAVQLGPVDARIVETVNHIKARVQENIHIKELASLVNLSTPRLMELFKLQTGVAIRKFRLWHRLYASMIPISGGASLTDAALSVGFSDSPHFSHAFSSIWGVKPSRIFGGGIGAEIRVSKDLS